MSRNPLSDLANLGDYLREQRQSAKLSLRQLSELAGVSNPYLSQIERGLKRPSAEILQQLAKGLEVSAETLYVKAGILDEHQVHPTPRSDVRLAIAADPDLSGRQKATLLDVYESFVGAARQEAGESSPRGTAARAAPRTRSPRASGSGTGTTGTAGPAASAGRAGSTTRRAANSTTGSTAGRPTRAARTSGSTVGQPTRTGSSRRRRPTDPTT